MAKRLEIIGIGPGDPELITVKGARLLAEADLVATPVAVAGGRSVAAEIVERYLDRDRQEVVDLLFPMRKDPAELEPFWQDAATSLIEAVDAGKRVVLITLGDPLLYSTSWYVAERIAARRSDIEVAFVPGVSSVTAAAAGASLPLSFGSERVAIIPATFAPEEIRATLERFETLVLMKVARVFATIRDLLTEAGLVDRAVYIRRIGHPDQQVITGLNNVREEDLDYLSLIIVRRG